MRFNVNFASIKAGGRLPLLMNFICGRVTPPTIFWVRDRLRARGALERGQALHEA